MEQRTDDWFAARLGKVTASKIADVMATTKAGPSASRKNYMAQLLTERLAGHKAESYINAAMQWGTDREPQARAMYELETGHDVTEVGFIDHPVIAMSGASPDGLIGDDGLIEIKCPNTATHIETLRGAAIDKKYVLQMQWQMACTKRQWCDFVSFDPRLPSAMQLYVARVERDATLIAAMESEVSVFLAEINKAEEELRAKYMEN